MPLTDKQTESVARLRSMISEDFPEVSEMTDGEIVKSSQLMFFHWERSRMEEFHRLSDQFHHLGRALERASSIIDQFREEMEALKNASP